MQVGRRELGGRDDHSDQRNMGLTVVRVPRQHHVDAQARGQVLDEIGIMGDEHAGDVPGEPRERLVGPNGAMGEVVHPADRQHGRTASDQPAAVEEHRRTRALDDLGDQVRVHPMVVVAEDRDRAVAPAKPRQYGLQPVEIAARITDEVPAQDDQVRRELGHTVGHTLEPARGNGGTMMKVGDERHAVAREFGRQIRHRNGDFGGVEPGPIPAAERGGQPLDYPPQGLLGEALEHGWPPLPCRRVAAGIKERPNHFATRRTTTSYRKCTPKVRSSTLTRSSLPCTPRDSAWLNGNGDTP